MAHNLEYEALGFITVSARNTDESQYYVIDGQHRVAAVCKVNSGYQMRCQVFYGLTIQEEAQLFRLLNNTAKPDAIDSFLIKCVEGDPASLDIDKILEERDWSVSARGAERVVRSIRTIEKLYARGTPKTLESTVDVLTAAYGYHYTTMDFRLVSGLWEFFHRHVTVAIPDEGRVIKVLSTYPGGSQALIGMGLGHALTRNGVGTCIARVVTELYNKGLRTRMKLSSI